MTLNKVAIGKEYRLVACNASPAMRNNLEALGLVPGERIDVIQNTDAGLIVKVKHSRLALTPDVASRLIVS